jgi:hypothetical protein
MPPLDRLVMTAAGAGVFFISPQAGRKVQEIPIGLGNVTRDAIVFAIGRATPLHR